MNSLRYREHGSPRLHGFTMVELLAVVAVSVVLIALLLSGKERVMDYAQRATCAGRMKNFAVAVNSYVNDHGGLLPPSAYGGPRNGEVAYFLAPYLGVPDPGKSMSAVWAMDCPGDGWHYGFNSYLSEKPVAVVERPADQIYGIDLYSGRWLDRHVLGSKKGDLTGRTPKPHGGSVNVMFMDFHCEMRKVSSLMRAQVTRYSDSYRSADETTPIGQPEYDK